jgi:predicted SprT family Zn-dependent metalloprotease
LRQALAQLAEHYRIVNQNKFDGVLPENYRIAFNLFLRRLTGRITYGERLIEISAFHFHHYGYEDAVQTLEHEMLHLYLHTLRRPSGHNALFKEMARALGIRVFHSNPYPKNQSPSHRYLYECPVCLRMVFRRRRQERSLACGVCCRIEAGGAWDPRFQLRYIDKVSFG